MDKRMSAAQAVARIPEGASIMVGGSMALGSPELLIEALAAQGTGHLTLICNDGGIPGHGISKLIARGQVSRLITTHVGLNPDVTRLCNAGELVCDLMPQGTFAECIRAGGAGLGGVLTPTGLGTVVAEGKQVIEVDGKPYLLERPLRADFALLRGSVVDRAGNVTYYGTTRNHNPLMAAAAGYVIVSACSLVERGGIDPHLVMTPGIFVDAIVEGEPEWTQ